MFEHVSTMSLSIGSIVWGVKDIQRAVAFWSGALHYKVKGTVSDDWAMLIPRRGQQGLQLSLKLVTSVEPHRHHMDLFAEDQSAEVERLIKLGAVRKQGWNYEHDADYVVLCDPDGNSFCVVQN
jgi:predicted enzyme related to lactoylglutathione lyase